MKNLILILILSLYIILFVSVVYNKYNVEPYEPVEYANTEIQLAKQIFMNSCVSSPDREDACSCVFDHMIKSWIDFFSDNEEEKEKLLDEWINKCKKYLKN